MKSLNSQKSWQRNGCVSLLYFSVHFQFGQNLKKEKKKHLSSRLSSINTFCLFLYFFSCHSLTLEGKKRAIFWLICDSLTSSQSGQSVGGTLISSSKPSTCFALKLEIQVLVLDLPSAMLDSYSWGWEELVGSGGNTSSAYPIQRFLILSCKNAAVCRKNCCCCCNKSESL